MTQGDPRDSRPQANAGQKTQLDSMSVGGAAGGNREFHRPNDRDDTARDVSRRSSDTANTHATPRAPAVRAMVAAVAAQRGVPPRFAGAGLARYARAAVANVAATPP